MESSASSQAQPATENTLITSLTKCLNLQADVLHNEIEIHNP